MSKISWPIPGTTYGPDKESLDALREVMRAWPKRGEWTVENDDYFNEGEGGWEPMMINAGDTWTLVRDTAEPEPEPARTVVVPLGWTYLRVIDGRPHARETYRDREAAESARAESIWNGFPCGPVVEVRAALPLPTEPAVVVGEVSRG